MKTIMKKKPKEKHKFCAHTQKLFKQLRRRIAAFMRSSENRVESLKSYVFLQAKYTQQEGMLNCNIEENIA